MSLSKNRQRILRHTYEQNRASALAKQKKLNEQIARLKDALQQEHDVAKALESKLAKCRSKETTNGARLAMNALFVENQQRALLASEEQISRLKNEIRVHEEKRERISKLIRSAHQTLTILDELENMGSARYLTGR